MEGILSIIFYNKRNNFKKIKLNILLILLILLLLEIKFFKNINNIKNYEYLYKILQKDKIIYQIKNLFKKDNIKKKNEIHISMSLDNNGLYPSLVSIVSALENNNKIKNILIYHLLLSYNFNKDLIKTFESLKNKYEVKFNYYIIPNIFKNCRSWTKGTKTI